MSEALSYLLKARPEAMQHYFDFIKKAGGALDPKTRAIISVITKIDNQTATGLRQYLLRALQAGVSADEIIDAMLMAFPTLGLTKIVWAIDIILAMDLPEFQLESLGQHKAWQQVIAIDRLQAGEAAYVEGKHSNVFIYYDDARIKVFDTHCPHQETNIPERALEDCVLTCPKHQWQFDMQTGECLVKGNRPLHEFESRIKDGYLEVFLPSHGIQF